MRWIQERLESGLTAICGIFLVVAWITHQHWAAYVAVAAGSPFALGAAWRGIKRGEVNVNHLMLLAAVGAIWVGHPEDSAALLFLFSLAHTLEHFTMGRTESAIEGLIKLRPDEATRIFDGVETRVPVASLRVGDEIRVKPFETVPADGYVTQGQTSIDQAAMTGEAQPVSKELGEPVLAGTQNLEGMILVKVTAESGKATLDKIVDLVKDAQENRASGERISQWFGQKYTFFVLGAFALALAIRVFAQQQAWPDALYGAIVLLVALSPCALVISTPATTLSALAWSARNGLLVRGGAHLENLGKIKVVALDKTGTLTTGKPIVSEICVCVPLEAGRHCREESSCWHGEGAMADEAAAILRVAAAAEQYSSHPIAEAIVLAARQRGIDVPEALDQRAIPGLGVEASVDGRKVQIGQRKFFPDLPSDFEQHVREIEGNGMTVAIVGLEDRFAAIGLSDSIRDNANTVIQDFKKLGVDKVMLLTGDNRAAAEVVGKKVGVDEIHGALMPEDKTRIIDEHESAGKSTLMVGDGINDAPSLTRATVGAAMGGLGSDIALNAADVVLMRDRLESLPDLIRLGQKTNRIIAANLIFATGVIAVLTVASFFTRLPLPLAVLGHEGSTIVVILNGLRLLGGPGSK